MRVLIGCEESQVVTKAFRNRGHEAYSCDLMETRRNPDWHIQDDVMDHLEEWDLIILHPPCTALAVSGNGTYAGTEARQQAKEWTMLLWNRARLACNHVALENPVGVFWSFAGIKAHYVQPWQFGHLRQKKTGFGLHNLPKLKPTNDVYQEMMKLPKKEREECWYASPSKTRSRDRSVTYQGIADAMAEQWGDSAQKRGNP